MENIIKYLQAHCYFQDKHIVNISELSYGSSHRSFKVTCHDHIHYFVKIFNNNNTGYAQIEKEVLTNTKASENTLTLLHADPNLLITPFIEGTVLSEKIMTIAKKVFLSLDLMINFHKNNFQSTLIEPLNFKAIFKAYANNLTLQQRLLLQPILEENFTIDTSSIMLCHGDLNFSNILISEPTSAIKLIDFECCCYAEVEYEIAMIIAINNLVKLFNIADTLREISDYLCDKSIIISEEKVMRYLLKSLIINGLWYFDKFKQSNELKWKVLALEQFKQADQVNNDSESIANTFKVS